MPKRYHTGYILWAKFQGLRKAAEYAQIYSQAIVPTLPGCGEKPIHLPGWVGRCLLSTDRETRQIPRAAIKNLWQFPSTFFEALQFYIYIFLN
jgi:hypothetical protein